MSIAKKDGFKKIEKIFKKLLQCWKKGGIIRRLNKGNTRVAESKKKPLKNFWKNFKKGIDKWEHLWYNLKRRKAKDQNAMENGSIAQLGEHLPYKQRVIGSSPIVSTNDIASEHESAHLEMAW